MFSPGISLLGSPNKSSTPFFLANDNWGNMCFPAPVYSVSCTTITSVSFIVWARLKAAAKLVFPAGPLSIPSSIANVSVIKKTLPWFTITYLSIYLRGLAALLGTSDLSGKTAKGIPNPVCPVVNDLRLKS